MPTQPSSKILWISDIHFALSFGAVSNRDELAKCISQFLQLVKESRNADEPIDYIILSGDLAQSGTKEDYDCFWSMLLKPLLDEFLAGGAGTPPRVLAIPGNHDVNWGNGEFFNEYLAEITDKKRKDYPSRNEFLEKKKKQFFALFGDYSQFLLSLREIDAGKYRSFFDFTGTELIVESGYSDHCLFGCIIDRKKQLVFVLLNSAWYSLGVQFDVLLADKIVNEPDFKKGPDAAFIKRKLIEKEAITEYGTQITGVDLLEFEKLKQAFSDYPDFTIITCMHHPPSWLSTSEYHNPDNEGKSYAIKFRSILRTSDLYLTGHEHIAVNAEPETIANQTTHLRAGCFLTYDNKAIPFKDNWFSILEIIPYQGKLNQYRINYIKKESTWKFNESENRQLLPLTKRNDQYTLTQRRRDAIFNSSVRPKDKFFAYLQSQEIIRAPNDDLQLLHSFDDGLFDFYSSGTGPIEYYLVAKKAFSYIDLPAKFSEWLEGILLKDGKPDPIVRFIVPDVFIQVDSAGPYSAPTIRRSDVLKSLIRKADISFDRFRHEFFVRYEQAGGVEKLNVLQNLRLVNHIVPYWVFEKIWL
ncbi:MAG: metallophosphoesterase [Chitinophagaceae bacterium]